MAFSSNQNAHKNTLHSTAPWVWLLELRHSDSEAYRFVIGYSENVTVSGDIYYAYPGRFEGFLERTDSPSDNFLLTVTNIGRILSSALDSNRAFVDKVLVLRLVDTSNLADGAAIEQEATIIKTSVNDESVGFLLGGYEAYSTDIPRHLYLRRKCRWTYRDKDGAITSECGYQETSTGAGLPTCDYTLDGPNGCRAHGDDEIANGFQRRHPKRFGGYPGIGAPRN